MTLFAKPSCTDDEPVHRTQIQAAPKPPTMQAAPKPPTMQPVMMMMPMQFQPQQVAQPINITIVNHNDNNNEKSIKGHHGEEH